MLTIQFERQGEAYRRRLIFPDGSTHTTDNIMIPVRWHTPERWSWTKPLHEYSRENLEKEGQLLAETLLGDRGLDAVRNGDNGLKLIVRESKDLPEIARVPWELACIDGDFVCTDLSVPMIRRPDLTPRKRDLQVALPLAHGLAVGLSRGSKSITVGGGA